MPAFPLLFLNTAAYSPVTILQTIQQFTVLVLCLTYATECKPDYTKNEQIPTPTNITLVLLKFYPPSVRVSWQLNETNISNLKEMQIFYSPIKSSVRSMIKLNPEVRQVTLNKLQPNQTYELELKLFSITANSMLTNSSSIINFISPSNESSPISKNQFAYYTPYSQEEIRRKLRITMDEIVILIIVLCVWLTVICIFCSKWSKLRHLEPYHPDYRPSLGSTSQHSPAYSVDSDNLANVGALTTTPVASGGLGEMTDEDDDGLLIGNVNPSSGLPIQQTAIIPCSGIHSNAPLFAHALDVHATNLAPLSGVLITDPMIPISSAASQSNFHNQFYNQQDEINDINIPIPNTIATKLQQQQSNNYTPTTTNAINKQINSIAVDQIKKQVQFQNVHHVQPNAPQFIAQYTNQDLIQRSASPATFVLPVSMATPNLNDIYCHGTAIAYSTNFSSIDSNTSCNSTSCASCQINNNNANMNVNNYCPSLPESLEQNQIYLSSTGSSSLKQQPSVESIYIELPQRYHVRSNSTPSEDTSNLNTVIYNATPSNSSMNKHSPLTEEESIIGEENKELNEKENENKLDQQIVENLKNKRIQKSKSENYLSFRSDELNKLKLTGSLDLIKLKKLNELNKELINKSKLKNNLQRNKLKYDYKHYYHSVDNISSRDTIQHSIKRFHSSNGLKKQFTSNQTELNKLKLINKNNLNRLRKDFRSDLMIKANRKMLTNQFSDEYTSSLKQNFKPFKHLQKSLTNDESDDTISSQLIKSCSSNMSSSIYDNVNSLKKKKLSIDSFDQSIRTVAEDEEDDVNLESNKNNTTTRTIKTDTTSTITKTIQSSDSLEYYERTDDELLLDEELIYDNKIDLKDNDFKNVNRSIIKSSNNNKFVKMYQSATMYNISSFNEFNSLDHNLIKSNQLRKHQSAEQMFKNLINNLNSLYRNSFKS